jgi:ribosome-associated translation inhibitor RaiA
MSAAAAASTLAVSNGDRSPQPQFAVPAVQPSPLNMVASQQQHSAAAADVVPVAPPASAAPGPASMSSPPSSSPSVYVPALYDSAQLALDQLINSPEYKKRLADSVDLYKDIHHSLRSAKAALANFESSCSKQAGSNPYPLPASMRPKLVSLVVLAEVANEPDFYRGPRARLERAEQEASKQIYEAALEAKQSLVSHLLTKINQHTFVGLQTQEFASYVATIAETFNESTASPAGFPQVKAQSLFAVDLAKALSAFTMGAAQQRNDEMQREKAKAEANFKAQEQVINGAHNGQTIIQLIEKAAPKILAKEAKKQKARQQEETPAAASQDHRVAAPGTSASTAQTRYKPPRDRNNQQPRPQTSPASNAKRRSRSPGQHRQQASSRQYAGHMANNRRDTEPAQPRPPAHSSAPSGNATASNYSRQDRDRRDPAFYAARANTIPPKNGAGGDKHPRDYSRNEPSSSRSSNQRRDPGRSRSRERDQDRHGSGRSSHELKGSGQSSTRRH